MGDFFISAEDLAHRMATAEPVRVFDVRRPPAIEPGSRFLPGSRWRNHGEATQWAGSLPRDRLIVLNCMHGHNVSQIGTALLREQGYNARALAGGVDGWIAAGLPTVAQSKLCPVASKPGVWVTGVNPGVRRVACAWLISRFIDPDAVFHFVEAEWVLDVAEELSGTAIAAPGVTAGDGRDLCSFDTLLSEFDLDDPVLAQLAAMVRGSGARADGPAVETAGLQAVMLGNCLVGKSDHDAMRRGFPVYDALYARLRLTDRHSISRQPTTD